MTSTEAMQDWLALEHEAVWLYPVIGARFDAVADRARASYGKHLDMRDRLLARLHQMDVEPVPTKLSYDVSRLRTKAHAITAARRIEIDIAAVCLTLAGDSTGDLRTYATAGLRRAALAEIAWGGQPDAFPGLPDQS
jgi:hypothetical protein